MTRYWFRPKRYGYGATPVTWEGWALTVGIVAVVALPIVAMNLLADRSNVGAWLAWAAFIVIAVFWMVRISRQRTDVKWRWRWGQRPDEGI
jgi:membrane protein YdbS with pleckstrin-like domain